MVVVGGVMFAILAAFGLAGQALTVRVATQRGVASDVLLVVMAVNLMILIPLTLVLNPNPTVTVRSIGAFAGAGIVGTMLGRAFFYAGIKQIGASRAEPIKASMPLYATVLAVIFLGEQVTIPQFGGILLIILGIVLVTWEGSASDRDSADGIPWAGLALPFAAAFFFGVEPIFASIGFLEGTEIFVGLTIKTVSALTIYIGYLTWQGTLPTSRRLRDADILWYVFAGLSNSVFMLAYYAGLSIASVAVVVPIMQTSPLIVVAFSAVFLRKLERVTPKLLAAAGIIVVGGILVTLTG